jgi:hypothetical protein
LQLTISRASHHSIRSVYLCSTIIANYTIVLFTVLLFACAVGAVQDGTSGWQLAAVFVTIKYSLSGE